MNKTAQAGQGVSEVDALKAAHAAPMLDKVDGFWYMATPYTKYAEGLNAAFIAACNAAAGLMERGIHAYSPIAECHALAFTANLDPTDHALWMRHLAPMVKAAHGLLVVTMPGWEVSDGVKHELNEFGRLGKPIHFLSWPELNLRHG